MPRPQLEAGTNIVQNGDINVTDDDMKRILNRLCHGDMYILGRLWIQALRVVLVGANVIPVVHAAKPEDTPEKPPPMKYKDLPIYQSPHFEYKDYIESKKPCPKADVKILHTFLYPKVQRVRKEWGDAYREFKQEATELKNDCRADICDKIRKFKKYMRSNENSAIRQAVVIFGTAAGYYIGSGRGIPRRIFFTSAGALAAGALCYPKETDEIFRNISYRIAKLVITFYNRTCKKNFTMRERLPCPDDLPGPTPPRPADQVNKCLDRKAQK